jgi:adenylosuccinate synthase
VGPGAAIQEEVLLREIQQYDAAYNVAARLKIDPRAVMIEAHHVENGAEHAKARAGVGKGCSRAQAAKSQRLPDVKLARDVRSLRQFLGDTVGIANQALDKGVLVEGSQGFDLDINHGYAYPHCTSRGCTPAAILADCGIDGKMVSRSIAVVRTFPIRVGNIDEDGERVGFSGDYAGRELTWETVAARSGQDAETLRLRERTTVSKRLRRVFEVDLGRLQRMSLICRPTEIALTFADYLDHNLSGLTAEAMRMRSPLVEFPALGSFIFDLDQAVGRTTYSPRVRLVKTGPRDSHVLRVA